MKADFSLADVHFIDGQALAPTDFGETDDNNNWNPKAYSGTYGTNGFHLDFSDTSDLGADAAGSNDWTPNNLVGSAPGLSTANQGFDAIAYTGTGSTQAISGLAFQPDLVWIKNKNAAGSHDLYDSVRGADKVINSDANHAEYNGSGRLTSFNSNGFSLGSQPAVNINGGPFIAWCWKAGGSASSNTNGTITSSVSANTTYGFSVVTYTGTGSAGATVGHGLGSAPKLILVKNRSDTDVMVAYHESVGNTGALRLTTAATDTGYNWWNSTTPSSSVFTIGNTGATNNSSDNYVAYCWSEITGFSKFGTYSGLSTTLGPKVVTGFKPKLVVVKRTDSTGNWTVYDSARSLDNDLKWNTTEAEGTAPIIFHSDGFQLNYNTGSVNTNGGSYIYMAFASKPDQSAIDSLIDTPTNYEADSGNNGGNYATLNPLNSDSNTVFSNGNLTCNKTGTSGYGMITSNIGVSSGKWYCEYTLSGADTTIGIARASTNVTTGSYMHGSGGVGYYSGNGYVYYQGYSTYGATFTTGDTIGIALDLDNGKVFFSKNGTFQNSGDPVAGTNPAASGLTDTYVFGLNGGATSSTSAAGHWNFGQRPFAYTPPTGYKSLCTQNLPDPTIADGSTAFDAKTWTGNGNSTRTISDYSFDPDFVWIKNRTTAGWQHVLYDQIRGAGTSSATKSLSTDSTRAEHSGNDTNHGYLSGFTSGGFNLVKGSQAGGDYVNHNNWEYVGWAWDGASSTATNTDGGITSSVRANPSAGFSVVTYTGTGSNATVGHGLNAAPYFVVVKRRNSAGSWIVWHNAFGTASNTDYLYLNGIIAKGQDGANAFWNSTAPTSSVFSVGTGGSVNTSGATYVAYCFAPVSQYSSMGVYSGNGSDEGQFVYTGFRPRFILTKAYSSNSNNNNNWNIIDTSRNPYNEASEVLSPNNTGSALDNSHTGIDILSNGFKLKGDSSGQSNYNGWDYLYVAFAEHPFKTARAR